MDLRALLVAYYFPPSVDAGAKRALGFFRHLSAHGVAPQLVTVRDGNYATVPGDPWTDPPGVVRVDEERWPWQRGAPAGRAESAADTQRAGGGLARRVVREALYVPDPWRGFHAPSLAAARRLHAERAFDVVWTTSSPWTSLRTGAVLAQGGLPWVADLRDLWSANQYGSTHSPARRALDRRLERRWLARAAAVTVTTEGQAERVRALGLDVPVHVVRNGYLERAPLEPPPRARDGRVHVVFAGKVYAHAEHGVGPLLGALAALRDLAPQATERVHVDFYGRVEPAFASAVHAAGLGRAVTFHGLVARDVATHALRAADAALVLMPAAHREIVVTKLYDAFGALVPVLFVGPPDGEAAALVRDTGAGGVFAPADARGIATWLRDLADATPEDTARRAARAESVAPYSYDALAAELAAVLRGVASPR